MTSEGSKRRDFLSLVFITKSISKRLLIKIFECVWLIELSDNKLSNNKLSDNKLPDNNLASELVENRTFFKQITSEEIVEKACFIVLCA